MAVSSRELAEAHFKQARFDLLNGQRIRASEGWVLASALSLAQFQQAAEKSMKAAVFMAVPGNQDEMIQTHKIWADRIEHLQELRGVRGMLLKAVAPYPETMIKDLETFAPHGTTCDPNTEYPWEDNGSMIIPAEHFQNHGVVSDMESVSKSILLSIAAAYPRLTRVWEAARREAAIRNEDPDLAGRA